MVKTIKIVTDSTATIDPATVRALGITVVPLALTIDGVLYQDGDLAFPVFMKKMLESKFLPKTSQPPVGVFADIFDKLGADGSEVLSIHLTDTLSGTVEAARQASSLTKTKVTVIDSEYTDQAQAFQVIEAAHLAKAGASLDEILAKIGQIRANTELFCGVAQLDNLIKGGRISRVTGMVGNFLNIKLILFLKDKELSTYMKGRGTKTFQKFLDETSDRLASSGRKVREIAISHASNLEFAETARKALQRFVSSPISILDTNTTIATHTGAGAWAVMIDYD